jgi:hypothetical protein
MFETLEWEAPPTAILQLTLNRTSWRSSHATSIFADIRNYPPAQYAGLLVLELPDDAMATFVLRVIESFISQKELVEALPGRLAKGRSLR